MNQAEARKIRRRVLEDSLKALSAIEAEMNTYIDAGEPLPKEFIDKLAKCQDQIRRDTKLKPGDQDLSEEPQEPTKPLVQRLKLVS